MSKITANKVHDLREEKVTEERYTLKGIVIDSIYNLMHVERKRFVYTALDLFIKPWVAIRLVLAGYRNHLYNAAEYLFICGAIVLFLTPRYKFFQNEFSEMIYSNPLFSANTTFFKAFFEYAEQYATITNIIAIPVFALLSYLLFFDSRKTFGENIIINTYITAQQLLMLVFAVPLLEIFPQQRHIIITIYTEVAFIYNVGVYSQIFPGRWWWVLIRALIVVAAGYGVQFPINIAFYYFFSPLLQYLPDF